MDERMLKGWKKVKLEEIAQVLKRAWKVGNEKLPYIGLEHIEESSLRLKTIGFSDDIKSNKYIFTEEEFLFGKLRPYFRKLYNPKFKGICSTDIWVVAPKENTDKNFLFYLFATYEFIDLATKGASGTRMPRAEWNFMKKTEWIIPESIDEQRAIASVLSSLDDKIDLLHRQNKTLEAMAETLFRKWFIEEAEEDWEEKQLFEIAEHKKVNIVPNKDPEIEFLHFSIPAFDAGKKPIKELGMEIKSNKYKVFEHSILISKLNPRLPRVWAIWGKIENKEYSVCSTEFIVVFPKKKEYFSFIYYLLKSIQVTNELIGAASGTSGSHQRVKARDIFELSFSFNEKKSLYFHTVVKKFLDKIRSNEQQIHTLEKLRDTLLPKLMSGEVRVKV